VATLVELTDPED